MDYVVGNVAALISGNVTPNRPKLSKRALTPIKHMPSPNVTPKSELVEDRSVFLSPSVQKKKAIVKKSPKRIFQNPDLDVTNENEGSTSTTSPKADKVKKHLKGELEANVSSQNKSKASKTPEKKGSKSVESPSPKKNVINGEIDSSVADNVSSNELTPKKKKKQRNSISDISQSVTESLETSKPQKGTPKKGKTQNKKVDKGNVQNDTQKASMNEHVNVSEKPAKKKNNKNKSQHVESEVNDAPAEDINNRQTELETKVASPKKKNKKRKKSKTEETSEENDVESKPTKSKKVKVNPNAITDKESDSEHESDNEIESETEAANKEVLDKSAEAEEQSSDEEDEEKTPTPKKKEVEKQEKEKVKEINTEEEIKRTLFVGNVPFSKKCKKEIKKIFSKYGEIESVRIRTVPVKDPSVTPKLAVIKQELHPERSTVNVYVKFTHPQCVEQALAENNTVLNNNHLRVTRSGSTGAEHDPRHAVFVGNIPFGLEDEGLREKFEKCGEIESVRIVRDKATNAGKGFGYVNFSSRDGVELALALTDEDLTIKNRIMRVKRCTQATQRSQRGGRGGPSNRWGRASFSGHRRRFDDQKPHYHVKRFTEATQRSQRGGRGGPPNWPPFQGRKISQGDRQRNNQNQGPSRPFNEGRNFGRGRGFQGGRGGRGGFQGGRGGNNFRGGRGGNSFRGGREGNNFRGGRGGNSFLVNRGGNFGRNEGDKQDGAYRRLQNKRKNEEGGGPPSKVPGDGDAPREKKARKEFVGMTAEKKKKRKVDKGQKKKKALSEILTK